MAEVIVPGESGPKAAQASKKSEGKRRHSRPTIAARPATTIFI